MSDIQICRLKPKMTAILPPEFAVYTVEELEETREIVVRTVLELEMNLESLQIVLVKLGQTMQFSQ